MSKALPTDPERFMETVAELIGEKFDAESSLSCYNQGSSTHFTITIESGNTVYELKLAHNSELDDRLLV